MIETGTVLLGKYRIERVIGEGGMGVVALAHHLHLDQPVAIKFLLSQVLDNHEIVQRFVREAQAAVKLRSEHVARVLDVGTLDSGAPYMVMEYLDGVDLGGLLRQHGRLAPGLAADLMLQACEALAEAHALGIVHRDIKPANFFVTRRAGGAPLLKVLDFGISKSPVTVDEGLTRTQAVMGTPAYMSPEQMRSSKNVDARTDIWGVGVVLHEMLTGQRPFTGDTFSALCLKVAMDPMQPTEVPLPPGLADVVRRCLEKEPDARFQNMAELAAALAPHAQTHAQAESAMERTASVLRLAQASHAVAKDAATLVGVKGRPTTLGASAGQAATVPRRTQRRGLLLAALGAAGAIAALIAVLARDRSANENVAPDNAPSRATATPAAAPETPGVSGAEASVPETAQTASPEVSSNEASAASERAAGSEAQEAAAAPDAGVPAEAARDEDGLPQHERGRTRATAEDADGPARKRKRAKPAKRGLDNDIFGARQ